MLILVGSLGIVAWITLRFRDVQWASTALVALLHDVLVVVGVFAILGTFFRVEIDALFVTAMLTVIGFSVHDTIVVFDRVRENGIATPASRSRPSSTTPSCRRSAGRSTPPDRGHHADRAAALRWRGDPLLRPRAAHRHRLGDVLVDLQRQPAPRRLARVGRPPAGASDDHPRAASPAAGVLRRGDAAGRWSPRCSAPWHPDAMIEPRYRWTARRARSRSDAGLDGGGRARHRPPGGGHPGRPWPVVAADDSPPTSTLRSAGLHDPRLLPDADALRRRVARARRRSASGSSSSATSMPTA